MANYVGSAQKIISNPPTNSVLKKTANAIVSFKECVYTTWWPGPGNHQSYLFNGWVANVWTRWFCKNTEPYFLKTVRFPYKLCFRWQSLTR